MSTAPLFEKTGPDMFQNENSRYHAEGVGATVLKGASRIASRFGIKHALSELWF
jgi:hypothetical protein